MQKVFCNEDGLGVGLVLGDRIYSLYSIPLCLWKVPRKNMKTQSVYIYIYIIKFGKDYY